MSLKANTISLDEYTTIQRDSLVNPERGLILFNNENERIEINEGTPAVPFWSSASGNVPLFTFGNSSTGLGQLIPNGDPSLVGVLGYNGLSSFLEANETLESNSPITYKNTSNISFATVLDETNDKLVFPSNTNTFGKSFLDYTIRVVMKVDLSAVNNSTTKFYVRLRRVVDNSIIISNSYIQSDFNAENGVIISNIIKTFVNSETDPFVVDGAYIDILNDSNSNGTVTLQDISVRVFRG